MRFPSPHPNGASSRPEASGDRADVLLELADRTGFQSPMSGVVHTRAISLTVICPSFPMNSSTPSTPT
jgi:hypothetical protein